MRLPANGCKRRREKHAKACSQYGAVNTKVIALTQSVDYKASFAPRCACGEGTFSGTSPLPRHFKTYSCDHLRDVFIPIGAMNQLSSLLCFARFGVEPI